jgi:hypothetical protein
MRFSAEDNLLKVPKPGHMCELVFVLDQPYSRCSEPELPSNIIGLRSRIETHEFIRENL